MGYHTGEQLRAARAMLGWEQSELAEKANISVKTVKRLEATTGRVDAHSEWSVVHAFERAGIEFVGDHDWRERSDGVRFVKDRTAKLRREIVEHVNTSLGSMLKTKTDEDPDFFERSSDDILNTITEDMREGIRHGLRFALNRKE